MTATIKVRLVRLAHARGLALPAYQSAAAAGLDLVAAVERKTPMVLKPGERALVPTGLIMELPPGYEGQVRPRSGLAFKHGVTVLNSPGTIDSDYRGEVKVLLVNLGSEPFEIVRGERIAQLVVAPVSQATLVSARALSSTERGAGGFGSTRMKTPQQRKKYQPESLSARRPSRKRACLGDLRRCVKRTIEQNVPFEPALGAHENMQQAPR